MSVPCMGAPQLTSTYWSRGGVARQPTTITKYTTIDGLGSLGKPQRFDLGQNRGLQVLCAGLVSGIQSISQQFSDFQKQLGSVRRSMVAESASKITPRLNLAGRWNKDKSASDMDGYGKSLDLMGIHGFKKKTALVLMDGVEIIQDDAALTAKFVTKVPQWRPTEVYSFSEPSLMNRRDQKKGQQKAVVTTNPDGDLEVVVTWDEPNPGCFREIYRIPEEGVLHIESVTTINGETASTLQVYRKQNN